MPLLYICPGCNGYYAFQEYHWPHCKGNPKNLAGSIRKAVESKFTKSELASIATHGAMRDQPVRNVRAGKRKPSNSKPKKAAR